MKLKYILIAVFSWALLMVSYAQVGIGTVTPDASAALDISSSDSGLLAPRVSLSDVSDGSSPISSPATGLLVYNTNAAVVGGGGAGFYYWSGSAWSKLITTAPNNDWSLTGNSGTNAATNFIGTSDAVDLAVRTNNAQRMVVTAAGNVGIGEASPNNALEVDGSFLLEGDFVNQQTIGVATGAIQQIPFNNSVITPITGTNTSITVTDGNGVNNSAVFLSGFARVFGGSLAGTNSSAGAYFIILQRSTDPGFSTVVNLTYTGGLCYIETPNGFSSALLSFSNGGHISYLETGLAGGTTYYYRLAFFANGINITSGTYDVYQRTLNVLQIKQ